MVQRLLVLLAAMSVAILGMAEAQLDTKTSQSFTRASKRPDQVSLKPPVLFAGAHSPDGRSFSSSPEMEEGSSVPHEGHMSRKSRQDVSPKGAIPGVLGPGCLQLLRCQNEDAFHFDHMEIHHADLPERSAAACGHLCLRQRPDASLVIAKLSPINEQLVCGCGDLEALPSVTTILPGASLRCSQPCPDGEDSCGGDRAVSVYRVDRNRKECVAPNYSYLGCYHGEVGVTALKLAPWQRWAGGCMAQCEAQLNSGPLVGLSATADGTTLCECGLTKAVLESSVVQDCGWRCPDGEGWCGGAGLISVYNATQINEHNAALKEYPRFLPLLLTFALCFFRHEVLP